MATPSLHDKGPGELDNSAICQKLSKSEERKWKPQSTYSHEYRYLIAKYAKERGVSQASKFCNNKYPTINEFTGRTFVKKYD